jgi:hypothetical protein
MAARPVCRAAAMSEKRADESALIRSDVTAWQLSDPARTVTIDASRLYPWIVSNTYYAPGPEPEKPDRLRRVPYELPKDDYRGVFEVGDEHDVAFLSPTRSSRRLWTHPSSITLRSQSRWGRRWTLGSRAQKCADPRRQRRYRPADRHKARFEAGGIGLVGCRVSSSETKTTIGSLCLRRVTLDLSLRLGSVTPPSW